MAHGLETRRALRGAFVHKMLPMEQAALEAGISLGTAVRWKREAKEQNDDWDKARSAAMLSGSGAEAVFSAVLNQFVTLFKSTLNALEKDENATPQVKAEALARLSDAYLKTKNAAEKGSPKLNKLAVAMDVLELLTDFIAAKYPQHAPAFIEILNPFGHHLTKEFA